MRRAAALGVVLVGLLVAACGSGTEADNVTGGAARATTTVEAASDDLIDSQSLLERYGFEVCDGIRPAGQITRERATEIVHAAVDAGIASGGGGGDEGYKGSVSLYVLDEPSLAALADIADPSEVCVNGEDPNDYVPLGPQALDGLGWRWVGAGSMRLANHVTLIATQGEYDELWAHLGEGPETEQLPVDFAKEVILAISHGGGVNFGRCGHRFDGYTVEEGVVGINWFSPGGYTSCDAEEKRATYAVAVDLDMVGPPPLAIAFRFGPRQQPRDELVVDVGSFATTTTIGGQDLPVPDPTTTTIAPVPPTVAPVTAQVAAGVESTPTWGQRAGSLARDGFDLPLPQEWESGSGPSLARASIVGRGELLVESYPAADPAWRARVNPGPDMQITSGPTALAVPTYELEDDKVVSTGHTLVTHEYRFASTSSFLTQIVRWYEHGDSIIVATLSYPDPDKVPEALTGLNPNQVLDDIRLRQ